MAKAITKPAKAPVKKTVKASAPAIVKTAEGILSKLKALNIEHQLQADIAWCLGSYSHDHNPVGLYDVASRALKVFKAELAKKTKGVTAKLVTDIENTLATK